MARLLPWLTLVAATPLLNRCGGAADSSTETGNPPTIDSRRLHIELDGSGVRVVGPAGSVSPGAKVRVTNLSTGERAESIAAADGSVDVSVRGSLDDAYEVTVSNAAGSQSVVVTSRSGDAGGGGGSGSGFDAEAASCTELENELGERVATGFSNGPTACETDADCVFAGWGVACYHQCGGSVLSADAEASVRAAVSADVSAVCSELESRCTRQPPSSCPPPLTTTAECADGVCRGLDLSALSCEELRSATSSRITPLLADAPRACTRNSDCTLYNLGPTCISDCPRVEAIAASALEELTAETQSVLDRFCSVADSRPCGVPEPPCPPQPVDPAAVCVSGQCVIDEP